MIKKLSFAVIYIFLISGSAFSQEKALSSEQLLNDALEIAAKEDKNVFVMFHASWCGWCKKMDATMAEESIKDYFTRNYVITHMVVKESPKNKHLENPGADEMLKKYGGGNSGIPYWLIFDKNGELLADSKMVKGKAVLIDEGSNIGCPGTVDEVEAFNHKIKATSDLTENELEAVFKAFRLNDPSQKK